MKKMVYAALLLLGVCISSSLYAQQRVYSKAYDGLCNIRESPSGKGTVKGQFMNGPEGAELINYDGEWAHIKYNGIDGFVLSMYLQATPTNTYTGTVDASWISGCWSDGNSGLGIFNNGTWYLSYENEGESGIYIMQNNEIVFKTIQNPHELGEFNETLQIDFEKGTLGRFHRVDFLEEEGEGSRWPDITKEQYALLKTQVYEDLSDINAFGVDWGAEIENNGEEDIEYQSTLTTVSDECEIENVTVEDGAIPQNSFSNIKTAFIENNELNPVVKYGKWGVIGLIAAAILAFVIVSIKKVIIKAKAKAGQAIADYRQLGEEATRWKDMDPAILRAIIDGDNSRARELYAASTGASSGKALMFISKIKDEVKNQYPAMLCEQAMDAIKDIWPYGSNAILAFNKIDDNFFGIGCVWIDADVDGNYTFHRDFMWHEDDSFQLIIKNGSMILKGKNELKNEIHEINDMKVGSFNFNVNDEEYKMCKSVYDDLMSHKKLELYSRDDTKKVENGELSKDSLVAVATKYKFEFEHESPGVPYWSYLWSEDYNIAEDFLDAYFQYYNTKNKKESYQVKPWESKAFYESLSDSRGLLGYRPGAFVESYRAQLDAATMSSETLLGKAYPKLAEIGIHFNDEYKRWEGDNVWNKNVENMNSVYSAFSDYINESNIAVRPTVIKFKDDGSYSVLFDFDILRNENVNATAKSSLLPFLEGRTIDNADTDFPPASIRLEFGTNCKTCLGIILCCKIRIFEEVG